MVSGHWPLTTVLLHNRYRWLVVTCCDVDILRLHIRNNSRSPGSDNSTGERSLSPMCSRVMSISQRVTASHRTRCVHITAPPSHDSANRRGGTTCDQPSTTRFTKSYNNDIECAGLCGCIDAKPLICSSCSSYYKRPLTITKIKQIWIRQIFVPFVEPLIGVPLPSTIWNMRLKRWVFGLRGYTSIRDLLFREKIKEEDGKYLFLLWNLL